MPRRSSIARSQRVELVCVDVDGTLVGTSGVVLPEVWSAAARVLESGVQVALCSGRPAFGLAYSYAKRLNPDGWHVFQNGASVIQVSSGASRSRSIPASAVEQLISRAYQTGRILEIYTDSDYAVESTADRARRHAGLLGVPFQQREFRSLTESVVRAQWLIPHAELDSVLAEPHPALTISPSLSPVMPDTTFVNMTPPGVDKATAVRALAKEYGVALKRIMMVGDGLNDVSTMRIVGYPVAMGNAEPEAREAARHHVGRVEDGGLAEAFALAIRMRARRHSSVQVPSARIPAK